MCHIDISVYAIIYFAYIYIYTVYQFIMFICVYVFCFCLRQCIINYYICICGLVKDVQTRFWKAELSHWASQIWADTITVAKLFHRPSDLCRLVHTYLYRNEFSTTRATSRVPYWRKIDWTVTLSWCDVWWENITFQLVWASTNDSRWWGWFPPWLSTFCWPSSWWMSSSRALKRIVTMFDLRLLDMLFSFPRRTRVIMTCTCFLSAHMDL